MNECVSVNVSVWPYVQYIITMSPASRKSLQNTSTFLYRWLCVCVLGGWQTG